MFKHTCVFVLFCFLCLRVFLFVAQWLAITQGSSRVAQQALQCLALLQLQLLFLLPRNVYLLVLLLLPLTLPYEEEQIRSHMGDWL